MTTGELVAKLQRLDPSGKGKVEVPVKSYTKVYPVAYLEPFTVASIPPVPESAGTGVRIYVSFPEGFSIHKRKEAR